MKCDVPGLGILGDFKHNIALRASGKLLYTVADGEDMPVDNGPTDVVGFGQSKGMALHYIMPIKQSIKSDERIRVRIYGHLRYIGCASVDE